jgi:transposase
MGKKELRKLSKNQLIELIFSEREARIELEKKFNQLEKYLKAFDNPHTPSSKKQKKSKPPKKEDRFPGKPPGSNGGGIRMPPADQSKTHDLEDCPDCHEKLDNPIKKTVQKQLDLPEKLAICTEHIISHYHCNNCDKDIAAANIRGRYGPRMKSLVARLKEQGLSCQETALTMREIGFISFCPASVVMVMVFFANLLQPIREWLEKEIIKAPYIHSDETGLRKDGQSGYVWGFFTKGITLLNAEMSRGKHIAQNFLGRYMGVNVTDGYLGYADLVLRQRCWSHLIREFKELAKKHDEVKVLLDRIRDLYKQLVVYTDEIPSDNVKEHFHFELNYIVTCLNATRWGRKLANLIKNGGDDWFTALDYPGVPFQNNLAERGLRRIVMHRKRMGCYRNEVGKNWINVCLSVMQTWRLQNKNVLANLVHLASN